jgi:5-deoxy-glucuronate isomerase
VTAAVGGLHRPAGSTAGDGWRTLVTPESAGWGFTGLRIGDLGPGERASLATGDDEAIVLPLAGGGRLDTAGQTVPLAGRASPFEGPTDFAYLPSRTDASIEAAGARFRFAVATARTATADEPAGDRAAGVARHVPASTVPIELRGAGPSSRLVRNFATPAAFDAERLIAVEVVTPGGNWSSYPPHKHDEDRPGEAVLEEIYYYEIAAGPGGPGIGYQRVYGSPDRPLDVLVEVRDGDVVLIPHGWHGPSMAAPGYDMYYLNVMAGPGAERAWRITDDPAHAWVRDTWAGQPIDTRLATAAAAAADGRDR